MRLITGMSIALSTIAFGGQMALADTVRCTAKLFDNKGILLFLSEEFLAPLKEGAMIIEGDDIQFAYYPVKFKSDPENVLRLFVGTDKAGWDEYAKVVKMDIS